MHAQNPPRTLFWNMFHPHTLVSKPEFKYRNSSLRATHTAQNRRRDDIVWLAFQAVQLQGVLAWTDVVILMDSSIAPARVFGYHGHALQLVLI